MGKRSPELQQRLSEGLRQLDIESRLHSNQQDSLIAYVELLERWNRKVNLTAIKSIEEMVDRHLLDSLTVLPYVEGDSLIDVGTGAGLPGIPIAIAKPSVSVLMLDSAERKTRFVRQAIAELGLANADVSHTRVQDASVTKVNTVVARAFSTPVDIIEMCRHLCVDGGVFVLFMAHVGDKLDVLAEGCAVERVDAVAVPNSEATRHIAVVRVAGEQDFTTRE